MISKFIAKHLKKQELKTVTACQCAICGVNIESGVSKKDAISSNFNDHHVFKFKSDHICGDCAACLSGESFNDKALRCFNVLVTETGIESVPIQDVSKIIFNPPSGKFMLLVTYSHKKHHFFYGAVNEPGQDFIVIGTDKGTIKFKTALFNEVYKTCLDLYNGGFNKTEEIFNCHSLKLKVIEEYGVERFYSDINKIKAYKGTMFLRFLLHVLQKDVK